MADGLMNVTEIAETYGIRREVIVSRLCAAGLRVYRNPRDLRERLFRAHEVAKIFSYQEME